MTDPRKTMTEADARRIQSRADRTGTNESFKRRAQKSAAKNSGGSKSAGKSKK